MRFSAFTSTFSAFSLLHHAYRQVNRQAFAVEKVIVLLALVATQAYAQADEQTLKAINQDIWHPFIETYNSYDVGGFMSIHSIDLVRIPRDSKSISDFEDYQSRSQKYWPRSKEQGRTREISFTFLERFHNEARASEVGIYKVISNKGTADENTSYGKFHVILVKEDGAWKILVDSDSGEGGTIGEDDFEAGVGLEEFGVFIKED